MRTMQHLLRAWLCLGLLLVTSLASASEYVTYLHPDVQGSPVVATNEQGQVIWRESYAPWGEREIKDTASANPALGSKTWYTGKEEEEALGLYYYGARWYSPNIGQFYSIDPAPVTLDNPRSFGRYHYANNNPIRYTDPDGRSPIDVAFLAYDIGRLGVAVYTGVGVGPAAVDAGLSIIGVLSPVPGTGQILKTARTADRVADAARAADHAADAARGAAGGARAGKSHTRAANRLGRDKNRAENDGQLICPVCKKKMNEPAQSKNGVPVDRDAAVGDHVYPKAQGGDGATVKDMKNHKTICWECNAKKSDNLPN